MDKVLIIIDMQNDFIDGSLSNPEAQLIVEKVAKLAAGWRGRIYLTRDTHFDNYMTTQEGQKLPVPHCIKTVMDGRLIDLLITQQIIIH